MSYPKQPNYNKIIEQLRTYSKHKHEYGSKGIEKILNDAYIKLGLSLEEIINLVEDESMLITQPNDLASIHKLRPNGPRKIWNTIDEDVYLDKLEGAFLSRVAGCILGAPVEFDSIDQMEKWAKYNSEDFPPTAYWKKTRNPYNIRYDKSDFIEYTKEGMTKVPVDDDIVYTILNLLVVEEYGNSFSSENVGEMWLKYLPYACTAEDIALKNLKAGVKANKTAEINNPYKEWIGADIRSDAFAYIAPGYPEKAARMAYYDAYLSHRRNGIYGEMFFAAAQAAAFTVNSSVEALEIGLTEIPKDCTLAKDIKWALEVGKHIENYKEARQAVEKRFIGMEHAYTNNNACLTVFGLMIGGNDITKVLSETVAMGMDNDCTAATAGSIVGSIVGKKGLEEHWYKNFNNTVDTYLIDTKEFKIDDLINRFHIQAKKVFE
jgi:ADP-ribosylglycohydrolase